VNRRKFFKHSSAVAVGTAAIAALPTITTATSKPSQGCLIAAFANALESGSNTDIMKAWDNICLADPANHDFIIAAHRYVSYKPQWRKRFEEACEAQRLESNRRN